MGSRRRGAGDATQRGGDRALRAGGVGCHLLGAYRWLRHPAYTGLIIFFFGLGLALSNWALLALLIVAPTVALVVRISSEERALLAALGGEYRDFAATRARPFPGVW